MNRTSLKELKRKFYCWKYDIAKPGTLAYYKTLCRNQKLSPAEIEELSFFKVRCLLKYAYEHVPFYRQRFLSSGAVPEDFATAEDFEKFPLLSREDLQNHFEQFLSDEYTMKDVRIVSTGGSSGEPVQVCHPRMLPRAAMGWRLLDWWNISPADDMAHVYRYVHNSLKSRLFYWMQSFPGKQILLDAARFSEKDIAVFLKKFCRLKPALLHGYVGAIDFLADHILEHGITVPPPKAIWLTSAPVTKVQRARIEKAFGAPVYDQYGCCEIYWLAAECHHRNGLHMFQDIRRIEFTDQAGRNVPHGEYGNITVTDLENYAFPLIRYVNGDHGRRLTQECSCCCRLPLMDNVKGRISEMIRLPSGARLSGEFLTTLFDDFPEAVKQFQVHQESDGSIILNVVPNNSEKMIEPCLKKTETLLRKAVNHEVPVSIRTVDSIPQKNGKLKYIISDVQG